MSTPPADSYRRDRVAPLRRFDEVETTVSHLFRRPHVALSGRSFGEALYDALEEREFWQLGSSLMELGGGAGFVAAAMSARASSRGRELRHTFVDLSRRLLGVQRQQVPTGRAVCACAQSLPFASGVWRGPFLANEVIADLPVARASSEEGSACNQRYGLEAEPHTLLNVGAIRLLEELARVLAPGARACLTEFGGDFEPAPVRLEGMLGEGSHVEHSIHFGHLERVARALGFTCERALLADLLGIQRDVRVASYADVRRLRRLVPSLPVLAFTQEELEARHPVLTRIFRFDFPTIGSPRFPDPQSSGGFCQLFWALILTRS